MAKTLRNFTVICLRGKMTKMNITCLSDKAPKNHLDQGDQIQDQGLEEKQETQKVENLADFTKFLKGRKNKSILETQITKMAYLI